MIDYFDKELHKNIIFPEKMAFYENGFDFYLPCETIEKRIKEDKEAKSKFLKQLYPQGITVRTDKGIVMLTHRQVKILELLSKHQLTKEIAIHAGVHAKTIEHHKALIKQKTGCTTTSSLVKLFHNQLKFLHEGL